MESPGAGQGDGDTPKWYVGHHESDRTEVTTHMLYQAQDCNYDMLTTPITTRHFHSRVLTLLSIYQYELESNPGRDTTVPMIPSLMPVDTNLTPGGIISHLLAVASPWIDLCSPDPVVFEISRQVLEMEVAYAAFCGVANIILPSPKLHHGNLHGSGVAQYAYATQEALNIGHFIQVSITMPMMDNPGEHYDLLSSLSNQAREKHLAMTEDVSGKNTDIPAKHDFFGTWDAWNIIRTICKYSNRLSVALEIPRFLPPTSVGNRWLSEPLRLISLSTHSFFTNPKGYPVFSHAHKALISKYMRIRNAPWILLSDVGPIPGLEDPETIITRADGPLTEDAAASLPISPTPAEASELQRTGNPPPRIEDPLQHLRFIRGIQKRQPPKTTLECFKAGYQDYLQAPLQPLTDNLESITYEVFEKDPVKYELYGQAIAQALQDWRDQAKKASNPDGRVVVAIVGAGRGPLVNRALQASETTGVPIDLWAVEKNPNAYILLQRHNIHSWNNKVSLVKSDMRSWKGPTTAASPTQNYKIDILISELLGSFADNELSPECLSGPLPLLNPTHGISIPSSYTAYLTPIAAPKLHADILSRAPNDPAAPNTPYVVMLHAIDYLSTTFPISAADTTTVPLPVPNVLPVWGFRHGPGMDGMGTEAKVTNRYNTRHARLSFNLRDRAVCHGLAGYFEAVLYPGVELSTNPLTMEAKSEGMMSWFPLFFPLKTPLYTPDASTLTVSIFRATDARKVWYEWMVESWSNLLGAGGNGGKVRLGVSEVGSSKGGGCMM